MICKTKSMNLKKSISKINLIKEISWLNNQKRKWQKSLKHNMKNNCKIYSKNRNPLKKKIFN